jgi:hypothetical protein
VSPASVIVCPSDNKALQAGSPMDETELTPVQVRALGR